MSNDKELDDAYAYFRWLTDNPKLPKEALLACYELSQHQTALFVTTLPDFDIVPSNLFKRIIESLEHKNWAEVMDLVEKAKSWPLMAQQNG
jgi:hypothetical protein